MTSAPSPADLLDRLRRERSSAKWRTYDADVLPAWVAEMDFNLAPCVSDALQAAVARSDTGYRWPGELPEAVGEFMDRHFGWKVPADTVIALPDVLTGMAEAMRRLTKPGESVVINPPVYPPFFNVTRQVAERGCVEVPLRDGVLDLDAMERAFTRPEVTAYLMCHPHNPTGYVADESTLSAVAHMARRHGVTVISDEIWAPLTWGSEPFRPYLSIDPELTASDVALVSASKAFNLAGLKCSQLIAGSADQAVRLRAAIPVEVTYGTGQLGVTASVAAYRDGDDWLADTLEVLRRNARVLQQAIAEYELDIDYQVPSATYVAWLDCRSLGFGDDPARVFLEVGRVALNAGHLFGHEGKGFVRMNFATDEVLINEAVRRMAKSIVR